MSNFIWCVLEISGDKNQLKSLRKKIKNNKICESLFPSPYQNAISERNLISERKFLFFKIVKKVELENPERDLWNKHHWGTALGDIDTKIKEKKRTRVRFSCVFADSLPELFIEKISFQYPKLKFKISNIFDRYSNFFGGCTWQNGVIVKDAIRDYCEDEIDEYFIKDTLIETILRRFSNFFHLIKKKYQKILFKIKLKNIKEEIPF